MFHGPDYILSHLTTYVKSYFDNEIDLLHPEELLHLLRFHC
jgi:hypothetical protein